jgi:hypothetical protein
MSSPIVTMDNLPKKKVFLRFFFVLKERKLNLKTQFENSIFYNNTIRSGCFPPKFQCHYANESKDKSERRSDRDKTMNGDEIR